MKCKATLRLSVCPKAPSFVLKGSQSPQMFPKDRRDMEGEGLKPREHGEAREGCISVGDLESNLKGNPGP